MKDERLDPYYDRHGRGNSQGILFLVCLACAAILCIVAFGSALEHLGVIKLPQWMR